MTSLFERPIRGGGLDARWRCSPFSPVARDRRRHTGLLAAVHARRTVATIVAFAAVSIAAINACAAESNHAFSKVVIGYASDGCSFQYSSVDFCDARHRAAIEHAIATAKPDFDRRYIVLPILERAEYFQRSVVAIDADTGEVYPVPIDFYSGSAKGTDKTSGFGQLDYSLESDTLCVDGSIYAAREQQDGNFCFRLKDHRFVGPRTAYTDR